MKILIPFTQIFALLSCFFQVSVNGSALPLSKTRTVNYVKSTHSKNNDDHLLLLSKSKRISSAFTSILSFTTLRQFEKEEDESDCNLWVDIETIDKNDHQENEYDDDIFQNGDDIIDDSDQDEITNTVKEMKNQKINWWKKAKDIFSNCPEPLNDSIDELSQMEESDEHPMRTDEWLVKVKLSPFCILPRDVDREGSLFPQSFHHRLGRRKRTARIKEQVMKFSKNGYVILIDKIENGDNLRNGNNSTLIENGQRIITAGKWHMDVNGISWTMQVNLPNSNNNPCQDLNTMIDKNTDDDVILTNAQDSLSKTTRLYYHADIHLSKFQSKPRMFKGIIVRDRFCSTNRVGIFKNLFRPVIASFTAEGIGEDTLALSYKKRGFGLGNSGH